MDIWVRSQDKESICKVSGLTFSDECDNVAPKYGYFLIGTSEFCTYPLGFFKNKEDALQVINEFQDHVCRLKQEYLLIVALAGSFKRCPHYDIFQIPEDKHV